MTKWCYINHCNVLQTTLQRTSSNTWVEDGQLHTSFKLSQRLQQITGLNVVSPQMKSANEIPSPEGPTGPFDAAEPLQVA